jgi:hypothetical protein
MPVMLPACGARGGGWLLVVRSSGLVAGGGSLPGSRFVAWPARVAPGESAALEFGPH